MCSNAYKLKYNCTKIAQLHIKACSYEPGLVGSSPEWDELFLCSYDCFYPASVVRNYVNMASSIFCYN